jgi:hypothetical protein
VENPALGISVDRYRFGRPGAARSTGRHGPQTPSRLSLTIEHRFERRAAKKKIPDLGLISARIGRDFQQNNMPL